MNYYRCWSSISHNFIHFWSLEVNVCYL